MQLNLPKVIDSERQTEVLFFKLLPQKKIEVVDYYGIKDIKLEQVNKDKVNKIEILNITTDKKLVTYFEELRKSEKEKFIKTIEIKQKQKKEEKKQEKQEVNYTFKDSKLQIQKHQIKAYNLVKDVILKDNFYYLDGSSMGRGKTYLAFAIAITYGLKLFVVCPSIVTTAWKKGIKEYNVPCYYIDNEPCVITYSSFISRKGSQPKHGLLRRRDIDFMENKKNIFEPTDLLTEVIEMGTLFIFDECQNCLSPSSTSFFAVKCITNLVRNKFNFQKYSKANLTRVGFLSGTMVDQPKFCIALCNLLGIIYDSNLTKDTELEPSGLKQALKFAEEKNPYDFKIFSEENKVRKYLNPKEASEYILDLFVSVIKPKVMCIMTEDSDEKESYIKDVKDIYLQMTEEEEEIYQKAVNTLKQVIKPDLKQLSYEIEVNNIDYEGDDVNEARLGKQILMIREIQLSKAPSIVRTTIAILESIVIDIKLNIQLFPKVILFSSFYWVIDYYKKHLSMYNPLEITGRIPQNQRDEAINLFQSPNSKRRLMLSNIRVGSVGIGLHDITGIFPRIVLINPDYYVKSLQQTGGRIARFGTKGIAVIRNVYGNINGTNIETPITRVISSKGKFMKKFHKEQGILFPGDYPSEFYKITQPINIPQWDVYYSLTNLTKVPEPDIKLVNFTTDEGYQDQKEKEKNDYINSMLLGLPYQEPDQNKVEGTTEVMTVEQLMNLFYSLK